MLHVDQYMRSALRAVAGCLVLAALALCPRSAVAQDSDDEPATTSESTGLEQPKAGEPDAVVVTGTRTEQRRSDSPVAAEVITRKQLEESGATNVAQVMTMSGGVQVERSFAGVGVSLQGLDPKHTLVLIDGERLPGTKDGVFDLERLNLEQIERIEILRGAGSALYGADAIGGVINIITRGLPDTGAAALIGGASVMLGSDRSKEGTARLGGRTGPVSGHVVGGYHSLPSFALDDNDESPETDGSSINDWYTKGSAKWQVAPRTKISSGAEFAKRERSGVDASDAGAVFDRRQVVDMYDAHLGLEHKTDGGDRVVSSARFNHLRDQFLRDQRNSNRQDSYEDSLIWYAQANGQVDLKLPAQNVLSVGVDGILEQAENPRIVRRESCDFESPTTECKTAQRRRGAVYIQDVLTALLDPYLVFVGGARVEGDTHFGVETVPRLAVRFDPIETLTLRTSVGRGYRAPSFKELYLRFDNPSVGYTVRGNTKLEPERSVSYQASLDWKPIKTVSVHVNAFRNDLEGLIDFQLTTPATADGELDRFELTNIASAYTQGVQTELSYRLWPLIEIRGSWQILEAINTSEDRPLSGRAEMQLSGMLVLRDPSNGLSLNVSSVWTGKRPFYLQTDGDEVTRFEADPYMNLAVNIGWRIYSYLRLSVRGENLLDEGDKDFLGQRPRRFVLALGAGL